MDIIMDTVPDIIIILKKHKKYKTNIVPPNPYSFGLEFSLF